MAAPGEWRPPNAVPPRSAEQRAATGRGRTFAPFTVRRPAQHWPLRAPPRRPALVEAAVNETLPQTEHLSVPESWALLSSVPAGRLAVVVDGASSPQAQRVVK